MAPSNVITSVAQLAAPERVSAASAIEPVSVVLSRPGAPALLSPEKLWSGPWYGPGNKLGKQPYNGVAAIALKRIVARARPDLFKWQGFDGAYNKHLENAIAVLQQSHGIAPTGELGRPTFQFLLTLKCHSNPAQLALDSVAQHLLEEEYQRLHPPAPPAIDIVKGLITSYWEATIANANAWHYVEERPMESLGIAPTKGGKADCSEMATDACYWARIESAIAVPDPSAFGFNGFGNSVSIWEHNKSRTVSNGQYEVADFGTYGEGAVSHVVQCIKAGTAATAVWGSNGSEAAPYAVSLHYRNDLFAVVRPQLVP